MSAITPSKPAVWDARICEPVTRKPHVVPHNNTYYSKCLLGGILSCGLTHLAVTPIDVAKCKMQVYPAKYPSMIGTIRTILKEEGVAGLKTGWAPTLLGYSMQGMFKFGLYEYFKDFYGNKMGEENYAKYKVGVWLASSASAELVADIALCPMEMVKVKMQTSPANTFPTTFRPALAAMNANRSEFRFPFGSLVPLWSRQIPYTMVKFAVFERTVQMMYEKVFTKPKAEYTKATQLSITFLSGYIAGVLCAIVSQPADNLVSQMSKKENANVGFRTICSNFGIGNLFVKGLGPRVLMVGTLTGLQWWIYDSFKTIMGLGTSGK